MPRPNKVGRFTWLLSSLVVSYIQNILQKFHDSGSTSVINGYIFCSALHRSPWLLHSNFKAYQGLPDIVSHWSSPVPKEVCIYCLRYRSKSHAYNFWLLFFWSTSTHHTCITRSKAALETKYKPITCWVHRVFRYLFLYKISADDQEIGLIWEFCSLRFWDHFTTFFFLKA